MYTGHFNLTYQAKITISYSYRTRVDQLVERQARDVEVRDSNLSLGSNFLLEYDIAVFEKTLQCATSKMELQTFNL